MSNENEEKEEKGLIIQDRETGFSVMVVDQPEKESDRPRFFGLAINELIVRINEASRDCKTKLEYEESGRVVAALQGKAAGFKSLLNFMAAEFKLSRLMMEDLGETSTLLPEFDNETIFNLEVQIVDLKASSAWAGVVLKIDEVTARLKDYLLFTAEKSRDLDLSQGQHKALVFFEEFFSAVGFESIRRKKVADEKRKSPEFEFEAGE